MTDMLNQSSFFGAVFSLGAYILAWYLKKRTNRAIFNPILISIALVIGILLLSGIEYQTYYAYAKMLSYLLTPATVCLAIPLYEQLHLLRRNLWAILLGIAAGAIASIGSVAVLALICGLDRAEFVTLMPKSVSTAISMPLSEMLGGNAAITAIVVILTGVVGNLAASGFLKLIHVTDPVAKGVAIGTSSHAVGTSRALELGEIEGAMSSLSIVVAGIITVAVSSIISMLF